MIKLCVFDFDSTLMDGETIDILAKDFGVGEKVSEITKKAMNGELDFFESLSARVKLLKGMSYERVLELCANLSLMQGANELISYLKAREIKILVFSGGFFEGVKFAQERLKFDAFFANYLHQKDGILSGLVGGEMMFNDSKGKMLEKIKKILNLEQDEVTCVGDGANDLSMFAQSGLKIAFCAKQVLQEKADICINKKDLKELIGVFG